VTSISVHVSLRGAWRRLLLAVSRVRAGARALPPQFLLLVAATFLYLAAASLIFPFIAIYMHERLRVSLTTVGLVLGLASITGLPLQVIGGWWADHRGRRGVMLFSLFVSGVLSAGLALAHELWAVIAVVIAQGALGWPLFLTVSNAMVADLVPAERGTEAFGLVRIALNLGAVVGPMIAALSLGAGVSYGTLFVVAGGGELVLWAVLVWRLRESRPAAAAQAAARPRRAGERAGYRLVLADRRFLAFCAVSLLPLFVYGQIVQTFPVFVTTFLHVSVSRWGVLLAFNAFLIVVLQYPLVRRLQHRRHYLLVALGSLLLGIGMGGSSVALGFWTLALLMIAFSVGEMIFVPFATGVASEMASETERGRYMGVWSLVWVGGQALGPLAVGWLMQHAGGRQAYVVVLAAGLLGAGLFAVLPGARRLPRAAGGAPSPAELAAAVAVAGPLEEPAVARDAGAPAGES
jgi:MFS family permease